jgi:5-methyltetrahydrofolate--homocysteine methyltransferase
MAELSALVENLINGKAEEAGELTQKALHHGVPPGKILDDGLKKGMGFVREEFRKGELPIPKVFLAAKAMRAAMDVLRPSLVSSGVKPIGKVALGTVKGDFDQVNKNLVSAMLEGTGFEIRDLGVDVPPEKFVGAAEDGADVIVMSAFLKTALVSMKNTLEALEGTGLRGGVKTIIVGFPVSEDYASRIGADGFSQSAVGAVEKIKQLMESASS